MRAKSRFIRFSSIVPLAMATLTAGGLTALVTLASPTIAPANGRTTTTTTIAPPVSGDTYYLSLGDSLSVGYQPNSTAKCPVGPVKDCTKQGYVDDLYKVYSKEIPGLQEYKLGCPGETTATMLGTASPICSYPESNQLAQAESVLENASTDGYKVAFVTIDIGANDVDGCAGIAENKYEGNYDPDQLADITTCVESGMTSSTPVDGGAQTAGDYDVTSAEGIAGINSDLAEILPALQAADTEGAPIYAMNLYDPFLALYILGNPIAEESVALADGLNSDLATVFGDYHIPVANVSGIFSTDDSSAPSNYTPTAPGGLIVTSSDPLNVQAVCTLTWECTGYENIHANKLGYAQIALAFENTIGYLGG